MPFGRSCTPMSLRATTKTYVISRGTAQVKVAIALAAAMAILEKLGLQEAQMKFKLQVTCLCGTLSQMI